MFMYLFIYLFIYFYFYFSNYKPVAETDKATVDRNVVTKGYDNFWTRTQASEVAVPHSLHDFEWGAEMQ